MTPVTDAVGISYYGQRIPAERCFSEDIHEKKSTECGELTESLDVIRKPN